MATATQLESLKEEATCAICLEYFTDPVFLECGNVFCRCCIAGCWEGLESNFSCPQCRETFPNKLLRPNRPLANIVEMLKQFSFPSATPQEENRLPGAATQETRLCREHDEKLKLFCENDQKPICVVCSVSRDCKPHAILPIREAAQEYRDKFQNYLDELKRKLEDVNRLQSKEEERLTEMEDKFKRKRDQIKYEFEKLQQFLEKEKSRQLSSLEQEERQSLQRIRTNVAKFADFRSSLMIVHGEIESKCQQEDVELLTDVKSILQRYENMKIQHPDLQCFKGNGDGKEEEEVMVNEHEKEEDLKMKIIQALEWRWAIDFADEVSLDPSSAHPWLIVSEDGRNVRLGDRDQALPDTAQRFDPHLYVLGRKKLSSGRHYWEVEVGNKTAWVLGVCDESVSRKGWPTISPEGGFWTVRLMDGKYWAFTYPWKPLTPHLPLKTLGFFLDCEAGRFLVYNVQDRSLLFTFSGPSFQTRTLQPLFNPGFRDGGGNVAGLRILPATEHS